MRVFGLDFGTTNSTISSYNPAEGVRVLEADSIDGVSKSVMRSVLFFINSGGVLVGESAIERYISDYTSGRFMRSVKTLLPSRSYTGTNIRGQPYQADDLACIIIRNIKHRGERQLGEECPNVVLGRPVIFSEDPEVDKLAENRLLSAAQKAGFKEIKLQYEPVAAALVFEQMFPSDQEQLVLVGDFGGGTSDFTVMTVGGRRNRSVSRKKDVISLGGVYIGGDTFDSELMWERMAQHFGRYATWKLGDRVLPMPAHITNTLKQWHLIPQLRERKTREAIRQIARSTDQPAELSNLESLIDENTGIELFRAVEQAKCELTERNSTEIVFEAIREAVERKEFEKIIEGSCTKIEHCVTEVLRKAQLYPNNIDRVFITGGTSHIPYIRQMFARTFGDAKMCEQDAFTSVGYGLGLSAASIF